MLWVTQGLTGENLMEKGLFFSLFISFLFKGDIRGIFFFSFFFLFLSGNTGGNTGFCIAKGPPFMHSPIYDFVVGGSRRKITSGISVTDVRLSLVTINFCYGMTINFVLS